MSRQNYGKQIGVCIFSDRAERALSGYTLLEVGNIFRQLVLPKFTYALPVHGASQSDLNMIQCFLTRCNKRRYTIEHLNIFKILEQCDQRLIHATPPWGGGGVHTSRTWSK